MSITTVHNALIAVVAGDLTLKVVERADVPQLVQKLPSAAVWFEGDSSTGDTYRFGVRLYVNLTDLVRATDSLNGLIETLRANLDANRTLSTGDRVSTYDGQIERLQYSEGGPVYLGYTTKVTVGPPSDVVLTDGTDTVTIHDCDRDTLPVVEAPPSVLPDIVTGTQVVYTTADRLELVSAAGRVDSTVEGLQLVTWYTNRTVLSYTDRHGSTTTGWRINGAPAPKAESRATASETYDVSLTLWRLP